MEPEYFPLLKSSLANIAWPPFLSDYGAKMMAVLCQLENSQWLPPEQILANQFEQLQSLVQHADKTVPFYRERFSQAGFDPTKKITTEAWRKIPVLARDEFQGNEKILLSNSIPQGHGLLNSISTAGSTGQPVKLNSTSFTQFYWDVFVLRDHFWHRRDLTKKLSAIRYVHGEKSQYPHGEELSSWGKPNNILFKTGPASLLDIKRTDVKDQLEWLVRQNPDYFFTYPTNAVELAKLTLEKNVQFPQLKEIRLMGELVDDNVRNICKQAWKVPVTDLYSANEVGYIALQCPEHEHYHVQSERVLIEILDDEDEPCRPGETGRLVVTSLHNFAMPIIRYAIGDYAEVGEPCPCGRGLPVLNRILGRVRNMLILPTGEKYWPMSGYGGFAEIVPVTQFQLIQRSLENIEVRLVADRQVTSAEEDKLRDLVNEHLGYTFQIFFSYPDKIERSKSGKFEEFMSEITPG